MAEALDRISFEEFSENLDRIFDRIVAGGESVVIETDEGKLVEVKPVTTAKSKGKGVTKEKEDDEAFLSAAGGWADVDIDSFLEDIYESRKSSRPPVDL